MSEYGEPVSRAFLPDAKTVARFSSRVADSMYVTVRGVYRKVTTDLVADRCNTSHLLAVIDELD